jgi:hypothetical protein
MCDPCHDWENGFVTLLCGATTMAFYPIAFFVLGVASVVCWRLAIGVVAARPIGDRLRYAMGQAARPPRDFSGADFPFLERLFTAAGAIDGHGRAASAIRAYYRFVREIGARVPLLAEWSNHEMYVCSLYLAARIERLLAINSACSRYVQFH